MSQFALKTPQGNVPLHPVGKAGDGSTVLAPTPLPVPLQPKKEEKPINFFKTTEGMVISGVVGVLLLAAIAYALMDTRERAGMRAKMPRF